MHVHVHSKCDMARVIVFVPSPHKSAKNLVFVVVHVQSAYEAKFFCYLVGSRAVAPGSGGTEISSRGDRKTQELAGLDFSKGFGPLITEPHETFGMQMLRESDDYKFSVELYKTMSDSDSEASGLSG